jgi:hypothetical protein
MLFHEDDKGVCLIDWDTVGKMPWPIEMGDAFRSWCNPATEDMNSARFEVDLFEAALESYVSTAGFFWSQPERELLLEGIRIIPLELSARFLADALYENYFAFDSQKYPSRGAHNLARGRSQFMLFESIENQLSVIDKIIVNRFASMD